jgi:Protein of unknown function (DUF2917)
VLKEAIEVQMPANSLLRVEGGSGGIKILCRSGSCWITQEGDSQDHLLEKMGDFTIYRDGLVVVQALTDTEIVVSSEKERRSVCSPSTTAIKRSALTGKLRVRGSSVREAISTTATTY